MVKVMVKQLPPNESSEQRAKRKWRNNAIRQRIKEKEAAPPEPKDLEVADVVENDGALHGSIKAFESRFKKEIRQMLIGHADRILKLHIASIQHQKRRLLLEKLRRLENQGV
jgi:hypothetical protein